MSGFFMDWDRNLRRVDDPGGGDTSWVDSLARYVAVMKGATLAHEATLFRTLEDLEKAGITAALVPRWLPEGKDRTCGKEL